MNLHHAELPVDNPELWWRRLVDAVIHRRLGYRDGVVTYLRWVESERSREIALQARDQINILASAPGWADVEKWPTWGYATKPPAQKQAKPAKPAPKRRVRR